MMLPTVHLNGTSAESLCEGLEAAGSALRKALDALVYAAPNGRDYYVVGPTAYSVAEREHLDRLRRVESVLAEIVAIHEYVVLSE